MGAQEADEGDQVEAEDVEADQMIVGVEVVEEEAGANKRMVSDRPVGRLAGSSKKHRILHISRTGSNISLSLLCRQLREGMGGLAAPSTGFLLVAAARIYSLTIIRIDSDSFSPGCHF